MVSGIPTEIVFEMYAERELALPAFTGYISRGLLLHIIRRVNPAVAQRFHEAEVMKPYSVTPLWFKSKARGSEGYLLDPSYPCRVGFRFLRDGDARLVIDYFMEKPAISIFDVPFQVASLSVSTKDYAEMEKAEPLEAFRLVFKSPTYLSTLGSPYRCLFPEPQRLFSNLMRIWNAYSTSKRFGKEEYKAYREWLAKHIGLSEYHLRTTLARMRERKAMGFLGWSNYEMDSQDEWNKVTVTLAQFAEYSNIGGNRTGGFGVTRFYPKPQEDIKSEETSAVNS